MSGAVLAVNAGSSSIKFALYTIDPVGKKALVTQARGLLDLGDDPRLTVDAADGTRVNRRGVPSASPEGMLAELMDLLEERVGTTGLRGVGHRIVHGGQQFLAPVRLTDPVIKELEGLTPLAPLHQPRCLMPVHAVGRLRPDLIQVGCFDTAFHRTIGATARRVALPRRFESDGIRRYGFHGLSYEYIAGRLPLVSPGLGSRKTVVAHLGNGASMCAMCDGRSVDTTMGFSALDGLVMGTRCGSIDPGVLLYLLQEKGLQPAALSDLLYRESGLLGVSGISGDVRTLLGSSDPQAREALDLFAFRAARDAASLASTLQGLDCLVFTAGIGENAAPIRAAICDRLQWLGIRIDRARNDAGAALISMPGSRVEVRVIPTDEESVIARHTIETIA
jgi:acetate kinase